MDGWSLTTNNSFHKGGRVWVIWNPSIFHVDFVNYSAQCINMRVVEVASNKNFYLSTIYAFNELQARVPLWEQLINFASDVDGAWAVCGDFNCVLLHSERLGGISTDAEIDAFQGCLNSCGLVDSPTMGSFFTWNNKQEVNARVYNRLDRFLINSEWSLSILDTYAHFLPEGNFDHTPCILKKAGQLLTTNRPSSTFRCGGNPHFSYLVWMIGGLVITLCTAIALKNLEFIQSKIAIDPTNMDWLMKETPAAKEYTELQQACHLFLSQKAKAAWLKDGDQNTKYFHGVIRSTESVTDKVNAKIIQSGRTCTEEQATSLLLPVTKKEIKDAIFSIPDHKAPGPDGFSSSFYKDAWSIIGDECKMPTHVTQFRPIACCNVVYKCISKIICNILSTVLPKLISVNQGGFVKGRSIIENILVCQDLVRLYNRQACSPKCMFKINIMKAYDSVSWTFLDELLEAFKFPKHFRNLIMECVGSASFYISLNGDTFGFFKGKKGLRQGDPMSPLLFTLCMEYLSRILTCATGKLKFHYHPLCKHLKLTHLMFADDLLMFCKGDATSMMVLLRAFSSFSLASGLKMNSIKSEACFNRVSSSLKKEILSIYGFSERQLPFKYLGVPITAGRLKKSDYAVLIDKIVESIRCLGAKKLSYAGRVDAICRNFLWEGHAEYSSVPRLAWHKVCVPKREGGLGLKESHVWNVETIGKLVWWLAVKPDKLWVRWVHHIYIKNGDWLNHNPSSDASWHWRKIRKVRDLIKDGFVSNDWSIVLPKNAFVASLVSSNALLLKDKLYQLAVATDDLCCVCYLQRETHNHLFQDYSFTQRLVHTVLAGLGSPIGQHDWIQSIARRRWSRLRKVVVNAAILACWYEIWMQRNEARLYGRVVRPEHLAAHIMSVLRSRVSFCKSNLVSPRDEAWLKRCN
ncbi:uncharacterized protein LOC141648803 [Silene latifolia]|uniref:uncharacterized protein LOC141648803 n=1 Tax=Silene latifolia TaxID=37657 RepID=UPI003D7816B5